MSETSSIAVRLTKLSVIFAAALLVAQLLAAPASAQIVERGVQGGITGAIIGGIIGGGRGAGRGAAIGAGVGVVAGAIERDNAQRAYAYGPPPGPYGPPPPGANLVYDTQVSLYRLGYNPGPPDGVYGQRTAEAISQYQSSYGLPVTGQPSPALLDHMIHHGG
jgi:putative peptidoglycan binding protein